MISSKCTETMDPGPLPLARIWFHDYIDKPFTWTLFGMMEMDFATGFHSWCLVKWLILSCSGNNNDSIVCKAQEREVYTHTHTSRTLLVGNIYAHTHTCQMCRNPATYVPHRLWNQDLHSIQKFWIIGTNERSIQNCFAFPSYKNQLLSSLLISFKYGNSTISLTVVIYFCISNFMLLHYLDLYKKNVLHGYFLFPFVLKQMRKTEKYFCIFKDSVLFRGWEESS